MSDFWILARKEIKNLIRDKKLLFGLIIVPLIIYPAMGKLMQVGIEKAQGETKVVILNMDRGNYGKIVIDALQASPNVSVELINVSSLEEALKKVSNGKEEANVVVVIPENFSESILSNEIATVEVYGVFRSIGSGMRESVSEARINAILGVLSEEIAKLKLKRMNVTNPEALLHPITSRSFSYINDRVVEVPPSVVSAVLSSQSVSLPLVIFLMVTITAQMAAGAVAAEKENKTLETLLTLPVKRTTIVASKISGTALMGLIAAIAYMVGLKSYLGTFSTDYGVGLSDLGLRLTPTGMTLFSVIIFLTIAFAISLAMVLAVFAEDVQSANTVVSSVILPLAFPSFVLMFVDPAELPFLAKYGLMALPFTHPILAYRYALLGDYGSMMLSIVYIAALAGITLYSSARVFSSEKVLTARIGFRRSKDRPHKS